METGVENEQQKNRKPHGNQAGPLSRTCRRRSANTGSRRNIAFADFDLKPGHKESIPNWTYRWTKFLSG